MTVAPVAEPHSVLSGGGEMGALMRSLDWSKTAVGPVERWPQSLRTALSILLETGFPMYIAWGREFTQFYNDGYRPILGSTKHPAAIGSSTRRTFAEIWHIIGPMFEGVLEGRATTLVDFMLPLDRHGFVEECYFIFSYSPIREESGAVGGVLVTVTETTQRVLSERRLKTTQALGGETQSARTVAAACAIAERVLGTNTADLPWAGIYLIDADGGRATLAAQSGSDAQSRPQLAPSIQLDGSPLSAAMVAACPSWLEHDASAARGRGLILPIVQHGETRPMGVLLAGTSDQLLVDDAYRSFLSLVASQIGTAIAGARALEEAQSRAEQLAALDRAKTAFFSNVSHEFRTPLTLILGPVEEALASPERALRDADLDAVQRNALRLLKLVNTLLDFSRIEAGRAEGSFEPTDLAALTTDISSAFRSAIERAGLTLVVSCPTLPVPVYVDREMWEKIVSNLLSNAFKHTFEGRIEVELQSDASSVTLRVRDTGVGIAPDDVGRIFQRFQRIERTPARTHEGSGIGLALVKELVSMHGGTIEAHSQLGHGTELVVKIPLGTAHLPNDRIAALPARADESARSIAVPYVQEALRWLPPSAASDAPEKVASPEAPCILVVDDNADMRDYLVRLLAPRFRVETAADGTAALATALNRHHDLIVSDVMMPGMTGFQLIARLREREATRSLPVIVLSARAGEEASVEGLTAGADDYLVKPFSARELLARIDTHLMRAKVRSVEQQHALRLASVFGNAPVGVAILRGPEHVFEFANRRYLDLVGERDLVGKPIRQALPELAGQGIFELLDGVYSSGEAYTGRSRRVLLGAQERDKTESFFDFVYQPLFDVSNGAAVSGIAVVAFDVTELTIARREAEMASRAKDEFLAMLGHELRNPLAPIVTALSLMRTGNVRGGERERTIIERQVHHLVGLVDDLLDISRITRGKVQLRRERIQLSDIVAKAIEMTSPAMDERGHVLHVDVPHDVWLDVDASRLAQVVANLLTNATKYTDPGGQIRISARAEGAQAVLSVEDSGRGIEPELLPRVFDLFWQERQELDRAQGGLGLGLAIVKNLVQAHGGSVEAHSAGKGHGSRFTVRLPLSAAATRDTSPEVARRSPRVQPQSGLRILVVDDNVDAAELLSYSLQAQGHTTRVAFDGPSALELAEEFQPEVALLDLGLPVMDGFELAKCLNAQPRRHRLEIVAITGYGQEVDRARTREAGFAAHMIKPVQLERLASWLAQRSTRLASDA